MAGAAPASGRLAAEGIQPGLVSRAEPGAASGVPGVGSGVEPGPVPDADPGFGETPGLAEEVELALARVLGRAGKPARIG